MSLDAGEWRTHLTVDAEVEGTGRTRVVAVGEVDESTAELLRGALARVLDRCGSAPVVVDLAEVSFMDSTGVAVLVQAQQRAAADGCALSVVNPQPVVRRVMEVTGVEGALTVEG
jgi:anti-sigma B factor antagonist